MAASMLSPKRPPMPRALSSKNSNPYLTMNKATATTATVSSAHPPAPDLIMPGLYLTDLFTARQVLLPTYHPNASHPHIKYTLSILDSSVNQPHPKPASRECLFTQRLILLDDTPDADILFHFSSACDWIDECISKSDGGVLVHCHLGQSRSAAVVIAYMMRKDKVPLQKALDRVKWRRSIVKPNPGFMRQLALWEEMEFDIWEDIVEEKAQEGLKTSGNLADPVVVTVQPPTISAEQQQEESAAQQVVKNGANEVVATGPPSVEQPKSTVRRRKQAYESWKAEQEKRTKRYLDNLV